MGSGRVIALALVLIAWSGGSALALEMVAVSLAEESLGAWDMAGAREAVAELEARYGESAQTKLVAGRFALMEGRYRDAVALLDAAAEAGAGAAAEHFLELARNTLSETEHYVEHRTAGGHFVIRHAPGVDAVLVPYAERALEGAWARVTAIFGYTPPHPVRVEIYPRVEVLGAVSSLSVKAIKTSGTIALCKYNRLMAVSPRDLVYGYDWTDTLAHEFIHLVITQKSRNRVPIWLHEGLAKHYETAWRSEGDPALERTSEDLLARALKDGKLISFAEMSPSMALLPSQEATATAFAEVFTVIEYLEHRGGARMAERLVGLMGRGRTDQEAVADVAKIPWARFEPSWRQYLKQKGLRTLRDRFDQRLLFKGANSEAEELEALKGEEARRFTWLGDQLRLKQRFKAATKEYRKAAAAVGDHTPVIQSKLGFALLKLGQLDEAVAELKGPLEVYPGYVLLHLYLGEAYAQKGDLEAARAHLEQALHLNPFDPDLHGRLAKVYEQLGESELARREREAHRLVNRS